MRIPAVLLVVAALCGPADAATEGEVLAVESRRGPDGHTVSQVQILTADGNTVVVHQLGGSVDGIGVTISHMPPVPRTGDLVRFETAHATTGAGNAAFTVRELTVINPDAQYVPTRTPKSGTPLYWKSGCVFVTYDQAGTSHVAGEAEFPVMDAVIDHWNGSMASCAYLQIQVDERSTEPTVYDTTNVIKWRESSWCRPASEDEPEMCYNAQAAALTTLHFVDDPDSGRDGEIVDADIEMNGVNFATSVEGISLGAAGCHADLANTLTHELGHLLGLDHTCWDGTGNRPIDHLDNPVIRCTPTSGLPSEVKAATMYNYQTCGETDKASLETMDIDPMCARYAPDDAPGTCKRVSLKSGGCNVGSSGAGPGWLLAAALGLLVTRRRRRSTATSA